MSHHRSLSIRLTLVGAVVAIIAAAAGAVAGWGSTDARGFVPAGGGERSASLAAGPITYEEHEQAVMRMAACLEASGRTVSLMPGKGLRPTKITSRLNASDDSGASVQAAQAVAMACSRQFLDAADEAWQAQLDRDPVKLQPALDALEECVRAGGPAETVPGPGGYFYARSNNLPTRAVVVRADELETYGQCALEFEAETGFLAPPPGVSK